MYLAVLTSAEKSKEFHIAWQTRTYISLMNIMLCFNEFAFTVQVKTQTK